MASANSSEKPGTGTKQNPKTETKAGDDLETPIKTVLGIVEDLGRKVQSQSEEVVQKKSRALPKTKKGILNCLRKSTSDVTNQGESEKSKQGESEHSIPKLKRNLRLLDEDVLKLQELNTVVGEEVKRQINPLKNLLKQVEADASNKTLTEGHKTDLEKINKKTFNLMCQVPLLPNKRKNNKGLDSEDGDGDNNGKGIVCLPGIHANEEDLKRLAVFRDVKRKFEKLDTCQQICLLSFAAFPENHEVNRTMLMYWLMGEGILPD